MSDQSAFRPRVVVIEPSGIDRSALRALLELWGYRVREAEHGEAALQAGVDWSPEAAVVGVAPPPADGYDLGRRLRSVLGPGVFLVAGGAGGRRVDWERAFGAGFNEVVDGDGDPNDLRATLGRALGVGAPAVDAGVIVGA